jgi:hypothetical protein
MNGNSILVEWTDNSSIETGFEVEMSLDEMDFSTPADSWTVGANVESLLVEDLDYSTEYFFRVRAYTDWGGTIEPTTGYSGWTSVVGTSTAIAPDGTLPILTNLHAQWDASVLMYGNGASVSAWEDTTTTYTLTPAGASTPVYSVPSQNGLGGVEFYSDGQMTLSPASPNLVYPATVFVVARTPLSGDTYTMMANPYVFEQTSGDNLEVYVDATGGTNLVFNDSGLVDDVNIFTFSLQDTGAYVRADGTQRDTENLTATFDGTSLNWGSTEVLHGQRRMVMYEVLVYDELMSAGDVDVIEGYLYQKWKVTNVAPSSPSSLSVTDYDYNYITIGWTDNSWNEDEFIIERSLDGNNWAQYDTVANNITTYTDTSVDQLVTYYYRVYASNTSGNSGVTSAVFQNTGVAPPESPVPLSATALSGEVIRLQWADNSEYESSFRLEYSLDQSVWAVVSSDIPANETEYTQSGLSPETTYYYRIYAINEAGETVSNIASATTAGLFTDEDPPRSPEEGVGAWIAVQNCTVTLRLDYSPYPNVPYEG